MYLALGVWFALNSAIFTANEKLFQRPGTGIGATAQRYGRQLIEILMRKYKIVRNYIRVSRAGGHGVRKVSCRECYLFIYFIVC